MRIILFVSFMVIGSSVFAQRHLLNLEIGLTTAVPAVNYEGFITEHFSMGAKIGLIQVGIDANYYFKPMDYDQWNGHVGTSFEVTGIWPILTSISGPTFVVGTEHISSGGFFIGLEGGVLAATYVADGYFDEKPIYPIVNFKIGKVLGRRD